MIPEASKGKRPASQTLGQARKAQAGKGGGKGETQNVGSMEVGPPTTEQLSQSPNASMKSPDQSQIEELESMGVMEYMLMLLLQTSRRLADLESTTYYTHFLPVAHPLHAQMEETYQSYLHAVQENKEHKLGPPPL